MTSTQLTEEQIGKILQGILVPPQPQIMVDLQMEQMHPEPDLNNIADLIKQDVGLAATMLKVVNSPAYGLRSRIESVSHAVSLLGLKTVVNIINGLSIKGELGDEDIVELNRFWDTAMDVAIVSASVAKQIGFPNADEAYNLGLFHNSGIPLMHQRFDGYFAVMQEAYSGQYSRIIDAENTAFKTNHAVVGYYCARSWNLPAHLCEVIADHHNVRQMSQAPGTSRESEKIVLMAILKTAEHMCGNYRTIGQQDVDHEWDDIRDIVLDILGLSPYDLDSMKVAFEDQGINLPHYY
ncbi:MAG: HDOD domain-containing protein [Natronospirillum sp.]|uniref:HDOD domain-containing protein n=1 Tax=Natronospirillum sp. TaxID=2812955 RepID=UPI0025EC8EEA|nr:HDOD domain-containing protein [Natronospirillum sp.]MCH8552553.1 HDOD domain-containing protein [Natronospirillum sp.]